MDRFTSLRARLGALLAALCVGAFWLGLAQGFALFYRHVAAQGSARAALAVFGGGAFAALGRQGRQDGRSALHRRLEQAGHLRQQHFLARHRSPARRDGNACP
mgnify:CR=1 FL=1